MLPEQNKDSILSEARDGDCIREGILQNTNSIRGRSIQFSELIRQLGRPFKIGVSHLCFKVLVILLSKNRPLKSVFSK